MTIANEDDFFGQVEKEFDQKKDDHLAKEEQRQYENLTTQHQYQLNELANEFVAIDEKHFIKAMKLVIKSRRQLHTHKYLQCVSAMKLKKFRALALAMSDITEFFFSEVIGRTSETQGAYHDELMAESSRFYVKDQRLNDLTVPLTNAKGSPTARFVKRKYKDRIGNVLPYTDWVLEIREGKAVSHFELPFVSQNEPVNEYFSQLLELYVNEGWTTWV